MNSIQRITIVTATDNHYLVLLAALLKSIEVNHKSEELIDFYIIGDGLSKKNIDKFTRSFNSDCLTIHWLKMIEVIPKGIELPSDYSSYPKNIYLRLFIPHFLPSQISKAIYLDVDMIVVSDISELWNINLENSIIGAVVDPIKTIGNPYGGISNYRELNMDSDAKYFNTGLLLMNVTGWRDNDVSKKVINCVSNNKKLAKLPDQYGLNVVLYKKWLELDERWNSFSTTAFINPKIIHFNHRKPIYESYNKNEQYKELFFQYLKMTEWRKFRQIGETKRYLKKLYNILEKVF